MSEQPTVPSADGSDISGQAARRKFLKRSGGIAIAAPAVVLLLSAASKSAQAGDNGPPTVPYGLDNDIDSAPPG